MLDILRHMFHDFLDVVPLDRSLRLIPTYGTASTTSPSLADLQIFRWKGSVRWRVEGRWRVGVFGQTRQKGLALCTAAALLTTKTLGSEGG